MAVWVRLHLEPLRGRTGRGRILEANALVNSGYRADVEHLSLPPTAAERLGLWPDVPPEAVRTEVEGYGGKMTEITGIPEALRIRVAVSDRETPAVGAAAVVAPGDSEILISDALGGALGIVILDMARGLWCFRDELGKIERPSEPPQAW